MFDRVVESQLSKQLWGGKVIILYGARQVGKTTLVKDILMRYPERGLYLNCDEPDIRDRFSGKTSTEMKATIGNHDLVVFDEAQRVENIGLSLKLLVDTYPHIQLIATGSSAFELSDRITEPLTGRNVVFQLFPVSEAELLATTDPLTLRRTLETRLLFGNYPNILATDSAQLKKERIESIASDYLFKDISALHQVKKSTALEKLVQALALQIGNEVSTRELATLVSLDKATVEHYINVLEKTFIVFRLTPFSRNLRKELGKLSKVYFYDLGIRNSLIANFNPLAMRSDVGNLWENYVIVERLKYNRYRGYTANAYFWRTYDGQEIDLVEDAGGKLTGFEIKWREQRYRPPKIFLETYDGSKVNMVCTDNYLGYVADPIG